MFNLLLENAVAISVLGTVAAAFAACYCRFTASKRLGRLLVGITIATLLMLAVEHIVVTDREQIEATLTQMATDVERNDLTAVLAHVHSSVPEMRSRASSIMPGYLFERVEILRLNKIQLEGEGAARSAVVEFHAAVTGRDREGSIETGRVPRFVVLKLKPERNTWRVVDAKDHDPQSAYGLRPLGSQSGARL